MLPSLIELGKNWQLDEDNCGLEEWDDFTDIPECFSLYLNLRKDNRFILEISVSLSIWKLRTVALWHKESNLSGLRLLTYILNPAGNAENIDYNLRINETVEDWTKNPEKYLKG